MGDRFYQQQLNTLGKCPGIKTPRKRNRSMSWTDDKKAEVIEAYEGSDPTPETSVEIVKQLAEDFDESPNGVRMILTKAGVYVKKSPAASGGSSDAAKGGGRVSKAGAQEALTAAITDAGQEASDEIISKLTGKAAQYFTTLIEAINK
jgi:hypothetical protein